MHCMIGHFFLLVMGSANFWSRNMLKMTNEF